MFYSVSIYKTFKPRRQGDSVPSDPERTRGAEPAYGEGL